MSELIPEPPRHGLDLAERFFREAREALLNRQSRFEFAVEDIFKIVRDAALRSDRRNARNAKLSAIRLRHLIKHLEETNGSAAQ
jgi:SpoVK/Ycf46/Vps4 family AAA+-type ATPase